LASTYSLPVVSTDPRENLPKYPPGIKRISK
jgi:hypothetical protein